MVKNEPTNQLSMKSVRDIKRAMLELIAKKPYETIHVGDILETAPVNKKTFYKYFASKQEVLDTVETDMLNYLNQQVDKLGTGNFRGGVSIYYSLLSSDDAAYKKLTDEKLYPAFIRDLTFKYFSQDFFMKFYKGGNADGVVAGYLCSAYGIYRKWAENPEKSGAATVEELTDITARLLLNGLSHFM